MKKKKEQITKRNEMATWVLYASLNIYIIKFGLKVIYKIRV